MDCSLGLFGMVRQVFDGYVADGIDGDFVYFGFGLHFLQLIPERPMKKELLDV